MPRTRETHAYQCSTLTGPLRKHNSTAFGIDKDSILNQSAYYHVTEGLVPDIMHDVLEGTLSYELKELIRYLVHQKVLSLASINEAIQSFPYFGADARNKPSVFGPTLLTSTDHGLKQSGK